MKTEGKGRLSVYLSKFALILVLILSLVPVLASLEKHEATRHPPPIERENIKTDPVPHLSRVEKTARVQLFFERPCAIRKGN